MKYDGCTAHLTMDLEKDDTLLAIRWEEELVRDTYYGFQKSKMVTANEGGRSSKF